MLTIYRRHRKDCSHRSEGRAYRRCHCPIWVDGYLNGEEMRKSLRLRDWEKAQEEVRQWEAEGLEPELEPAPELVTIEQACEQFEKDAKARNLREPTLYKYRLLFRQMKAFAKTRGFRFLKELNLGALREFRESWPNRNYSAKKKLEHMRAFFRFAQESGWIPDNPATKIKSPKITDPPTLPLTEDEVNRILSACWKYPNKMAARRLWALVLLLRYSGLRIRDAVTLSRDRIKNGKLFLYTAKTGTPVNCPLPPFVVEALETARRTSDRYFFWTGESNPKSAVGNWQRALKKLCRLAEVPDAHAHRFRDTFAVELLKKGVKIERVSILLGHQSVRITEKHYRPWVSDLQEQLEADVRATWESSEAKRRVHGGYTGRTAFASHLISIRKNGGGGGSRTTVLNFKSR